MAKSKDRDAVPGPNSAEPSKALLIELQGKRDADDEGAATASTEMFAALSIEEVLAYLRNRRPEFEVVELKVLGKVQVLSSSENLE